MPPITMDNTLLVGFKAGQARGRSEISLELEAPSGLRQPLAQGLSVLWEGEIRGANLVIRLNWTAQHEGLYWIDVVLDGSRVTRVPVRIVYLRQETGPLALGQGPTQ